MRTKTAQHVMLSVLLAAGVGLARGEDFLEFTTGGPQALDVGDGLHYYGVQSMLSHDWYPDHDGETTIMGDWFTVPQPVRVTDVEFWGLMKQYGGGPGELHVFIYGFDSATGVLTEIYHAWDDNMPSWDAYCVGEEDPSGLGTEAVTRWRVPLNLLPHHTGETLIDETGIYVLSVAGDDWADEFQWAANAPGGLTAGLYDELWWSPTTDVDSTGLDWSRHDLQATPQASNLAFGLTLMVPFVDCNSNAINDIDEIAAGSSTDCNINHVPDECEPDYDGDTVIDVCDDDIDGDGVNNAADVCDWSPPGAIVEPDGSILGDLDGDCDVDLADFSMMQARFTGPRQE